MRTARGVLFVAALLLVSCAAQQQEKAESPPPPPAHPSIEGNFRAVSRADIGRGLAIVRTQIVKQYGDTFPIYSVYVVDQNHMSIRYWAKGSQTWSYVERIRGQWKFTETAIERVIRTDSYLPTS
jgi:hypothetical protein